MTGRFTLLHLVLAGLLCGVGLGVFGFWIGLRTGAQEFQFADAQYKASIVAFQLERLSGGDIATLDTLMQIELDYQLALHGEYLDSNWRWMWPEAASPTDREIKHAVNYRLHHPFTEPDMSSPASWKTGVEMNDPFVLEVIAGQRHNKELIAKVLAKYGD